MKTLKKKVLKDRRHRKIRSKVSGTAECPRLAVFCSLSNNHVQVIDDVRGSTLFSTNDMKIKTGSKSERAVEVGKKIALMAKDKKIENVVFDRGGKRYQGRVKALAEAARAGGLKF